MLKKLHTALKDLRDFTSGKSIDNLLEFCSSFDEALRRHFDTLDAMVDAAYESEVYDLKSFRANLRAYLKTARKEILEFKLPEGKTK